MSQKLQSQIFSLLPNNLSRRKQINHFTVNYIDGRQAKANAYTLGQTSSSVTYQQYVSNSHLWVPVLL